MVGTITTRRNTPRPLTHDEMDDNLVTLEAGATAALRKNSNLSDLLDIAIARNNLGLGSMSLQETSSYYSRAEVNSLINSLASGQITTSELYFGSFDSEAALRAATPTQNPDNTPYAGVRGQYAFVGEGAGQGVDLFLWDFDETRWEEFAPTLSASNIKALYEGNDNTNAFTDAEKTKLSTLVSSNFVGVFPSENALIDGTDSGSGTNQGAFAFVDGGVNSRVQLYLWDSDSNDGDGEWEDYAVTTAETPAQIKTKYESNADTNVLTDSEKLLLGGLSQSGGLTSEGVKSLYEANPDTNAFTDANSNSLAALILRPQLFFGDFVSLQNLLDATPEFELDGSTPYRGDAGAYATVSAQNSDIALYLNDEGTWHRVGGLTPDQSTKLAGIETSAQANVQSDWDSTSGDSFIRNKPQVITSSERTKLQNLPDINDGNSIYQIDASATPTEVDISFRNDDGDNFATIPLATNVNAGLLSPAEKQAIAGIEDNVQADWDETNTSSDAYIRNKPTPITPRTDEEIRTVVGTLLRGGEGINIQVDDANNRITIIATGAGTTGGEDNVQANWDETNSSSDAFIQNKPEVITNAERIKLAGINSGAEVNVQSDWDALTGDAFIINKPTTISSSERSKLAGIDSGAEVNQTDGVIKNQYEANPDTNAFTDAEKTKLAGLQTSLFVGVFSSETALIDGTDVPTEGSFAFVDAGDTSPTELYLWDLDVDGNDGEWQNHGETSAETAESVKTKYESNPDTNVFTDSEKSKLATVGNNAEQNVQSDWDESNSSNDAYIRNKPSIPTLRTASQTADLLETLTGTNRLSASAIRDLPTTAQNFAGVFEDFATLTEEEGAFTEGSYAIVASASLSPELYLYDTSVPFWVRVGAPAAPATQIQAGIVQRNTQAEVDAGTDNQEYFTVSQLLQTLSGEDDTALSVRLEAIMDGYVPIILRSLAAGSVGSYAFAQNTSGSLVRFGGTIAGSSLRPANAVNDLFSSSSPLLGTWMCVGYSASSGEGRTSLFVRIR